MIRMEMGKKTKNPEITLKVSAAHKKHQLVYLNREGNMELKGGVGNWWTIGWVVD